MTNINIDIKPSGIASAYIDLPFDEAKESLEKENYRIISLEQNASLRMQQGIDAYVSKNGNYVREGAIYVPKKGVFLTKNSPIMKNAKKATECHRKGKDYHLTNDQVEEALSESVKLKEKAIPTNRFSEEDITNYAFGDTAQKYGDFLKEYGINEMPVDLVNLEDHPFARQVWLHSIGVGSGSVLFCGIRGLFCGDRVRGVRELNAEGTKNFSEAYTPNQIAKTLKTLSLSGLEEQILSELKNR